MESNFSALLLFKNAEKYKSKYKVKGVQFYTPSEPYKPEEIDALILFHSRELKLLNLGEFFNLKIIKTITAGTDHIPPEYHKKYHITGTHGPNAIYIAEHALSLALSCSRKLVYHTETMKRGEFHQTDILSKSLLGSNVLILGFGPIGRYTAGLFKRAFSSQIYVYKKSVRIHHLLRGRVNKIIIDRNELIKNLGNMDVVINTLPLTPETQNFIDETFLFKLKNNAIIVNVSRGRVIKESALFEFLKSRPMACAGIDVWYKYPDKKSNKFRQNYPFETLDNIVMTPHNAPVVKGYFENMVKGAMYQIKWDLLKLTKGG